LLNVKVETMELVIAPFTAPEAVLRDGHVFDQGRHAWKRRVMCSK